MTVDVTDGAAVGVRIESVAAGGDGVGRLADGMTVFVPRTAPGDRVALTRLRRHRRHANAEAAAILERGPDRVAPRCPHFERDGCGGCQWQHLGAEAQRRAKGRIVGDALRRIGGLKVEDPAVVASPRDFGYRATLTLTVRWLGGGPVAGFHHHAEADRVFLLERCEIARPELSRLWDAVRPALDALPRGSDVRLKLRVDAGGALHLVVGGGEGAWTTPGPLAQAAAAQGLAATVWWEPAGGAIRRMAGPAGDRGAVAFAQVNPEIAGALRAAVLAAAPSPAGGRALDLYAGAGETAILLAAAGWEVAAVELNEAAAARAAERAAATHVQVRTLAARVEAVIAELLPARLVVANPPRAGLDEAVTAALAARPPERLIYVSCDPATLARDLRRLGAGPVPLTPVSSSTLPPSGWQLSFACYDMFPQTAHVETLAVLSRSGG